MIGPGGGNRVHAFEYGWLDMMRTVRLFTLGWRQPRSSRSAHLSRTRTWQRGQWRHGDRRNRSAICRGSMNEEAGIQLRVLNNLWPYRDAVITSTVGYSGIRLRHATPRR
ncbi:MAG TPA: hypothetical protein VFX16_00225 [Pseudonocardiaceae bacterium]|nr:hypothetical protein [Pseudonocardiaceae bacterium]